jgi:integrase
MPNVNFYLKAPDLTTGKSAVFLQFKYSGHRLKFYFGQSIDPEIWNDKKQRVRNSRMTTADGQHSLNDLLNNLEEVLLAAYRQELANGIPLPETLKKHLGNFMNANIGKVKAQKPTLHDLIDRFISGEIKKKGGREKSQRTRQNYNAVKLHLEGFEKKYRYRIDFDTITLDFFYKYITFLQKDLALAPNTIAKDITFLKVFMNKAVSLGYTTNLQFKNEDFSFTEEVTDAVYLKEEELISLFEYDLSGNKKLESVKDLFVFGAFTGLRFSDYSNVRPENIIDEAGDLFLRIKTQKTGETVFVPCHPIVLKIFEKYAERPNKLPKTISNQKFNDYIKDACREAKMEEKGRLASRPELPLWECISSHTARRSFATNLFLAGVHPAEIMEVTGHKTEKAFKKYIRITRLDTAKRINKHMKEMWIRRNRSLMTAV